MKEALKNLQIELRKYRGSIKRIAAQLGTTEEWVGRVLAGKVHNERVVKMAIVVLQEMRKEQITQKAAKEQYYEELGNMIMSSLNPS